MSVLLKIKSKHLALEAGVIRFEENKLKKQIRYLRDKGMPHIRVEGSLNNICAHRRWDVRNENRATFLARAYIAGKSYKQLEHKVKDYNLLVDYIVPRVTSMVKKYHSYKTTDADILNWIKNKCDRSPG